MDDWEYRPARDRDLPFKERFKSVNRESSLITAAISFAWSFLLRLYLRIVHRLRVEGRHHIPETPSFFLIANHTSHLDALALSSILPLRWSGHVYSVAAGDTFFETTGSTVFASQCLNALPLWRKKIASHALEDLRDRLSTGANVLILFPEGTRSRDGRLGPFKPGIGKLVAGTTIPVLPCHIEGAHRAWPPTRKYPRFSPIVVAVGEPLTFSEVTDDRTGWNEIARSLESAVAGLANR